MATPAPTITKIGEQDGSVFMAVWALTTADHTGKEIELPEWFDCTWHFVAANIGGSVAGVESSSTTTSAEFAVCKNAAGGAAIAINSSPALATPIERSRYVRPRLTTVGAAAVWTITLVARRQNIMRN